MLGTLYSHVGNVFVKPPAEYGISISRRIWGFNLPLNMVFLFPAEMADITERAAPARHDYQ
jgi:hypothetical protein